LPQKLGDKIQKIMFRSPKTAIFDKKERLFSLKIDVPESSRNWHFGAI